MTPADMAALHALCFTHPAPWSEASFAAFAADPLCFTLTEADSLLIGRVAAGEAELLTLAVAPQNRRRGLGARLVSRFVYQARLRAADHAFLEVAANNTPAITLYTAAGFAPTGLRRGYYRTPGRPPVDAVLMARVLGPPDAPNI
ncbi:MAG: GNAT family N-acetyltransferase [Rhodobacteraceae bacterium]|jgi:ribosomal-protein-alanine N-acetyltransferase|nr:GNAT family N-acetyltransferase [Paracoccaceae bacterium]